MVDVGRMDDSLVALDEEIKRALFENGCLRDTDGNPYVQMVSSEDSHRDVIRELSYCQFLNEDTMADTIDEMFGEGSGEIKRGMYEVIGHDAAVKRLWREAAPEVSNIFGVNQEDMFDVFGDVETNLLLEYVEDWSDVDFDVALPDFLDMPIRVDICTDKDGDGTKVYLVEMPLREYFSCQRAIDMKNDEGFIEVDENTIYGSHDFWNASGGDLKSDLTSSVRLPFSSISELVFDCGKCGDISSTHEVSSDLWKHGGVLKVDYKTPCSKVISPNTIKGRMDGIDVVGQGDRQMQSRDDVGKGGR